MAAATRRAIHKDLIGSVSLTPGDFESLRTTYDQDLWALAKAATAGRVIGFKPATYMSRTSRGKVPIPSIN
jgi:hypothetical protein